MALIWICAGMARKDARRKQGFHKIRGGTEHVEDICIHYIVASRHHIRLRPMAAPGRPGNRNRRHRAYDPRDTHNGQRPDYRSTCTAEQTRQETIKVNP